MLPGKEGEAPNEAEGGHAMIGREGENKRVGNRVQCHSLNVTPADQTGLNSVLLHGEELIQVRMNTLYIHYQAVLYSAVL